MRVQRSASGSPPAVTKKIRRGYIIEYPAPDFLIFTILMNKSSCANPDSDIDHPEQTIAHN